MLHKLEGPVVGAANREAPDDSEVAPVDLEGGDLNLVRRAANAEHKVFAAVLHVLERVREHACHAGRVDHDVETIGGDLAEPLFNGVIRDDDIGRTVFTGKMKFGFHHVYSGDRCGAVDAACLDVKLA